MEHDGMKRKLSRRAVLRTSLQGAGAALLAACGAAPATTSEATTLKGFHLAWGQTYKWRMTGGKR